MSERVGTSASLGLGDEVMSRIMGRVWWVDSGRASWGAVLANDEHGCVLIRLRASSWLPQPSWPSLLPPASPLRPSGYPPPHLKAGCSPRP